MGGTSTHTHTHENTDRLADWRRKGAVRLSDLLDTEVAKGFGRLLVGVNNNHLVGFRLVVMLDARIKHNA